MAFWGLGADQRNDIAALCVASSLFVVNELGFYRARLSIQITLLQDVPEAHGKSFSVEGSMDPGACVSFVVM